jgi:hypothetical protein
MRNKTRTGREPQDASGVTQLGNYEVKGWDEPANVFELSGDGGRHSFGVKIEEGIGGCLVLVSDVRASARDDVCAKSVQPILGDDADLVREVAPQTTKRQCLIAVEIADQVRKVADATDRCPTRSPARHLTRGTIAQYGAVVLDRDFLGERPV